MSKFRGPNILILVLDAVRAKQMSTYGYGFPTTPHLARFAAGSVLFKRAFAPATWTVPTHASMLSGLYLSQHRIESVKADRRFAKEIITLPEALRTGGYRTAAFSSNVLFSPEHHFTGFEEFYDVDRLVASRRLSRYIPRALDRTDGLRNRSLRYIRKVLAPRLLLSSMAQWFEAQVVNKAPVFCVANLTTAHYPWAVPPHILWKNLHFHPKYLFRREYVTLDPFRFNSGRRKVTDAHRRVWQCLYNAALMHLDKEVGQFLKHIGRFRDTIIVVTADHGEMLGEYRNIVGHTLNLHDNLIHVPLIVRHPDYPPGLSVNRVVQNMDLYSSALEWANAPLDRIADAQLQRPSLSSAVATPDDAGGYAFAEEDYTDSYDLLDGLRKYNPSMDPHQYPRRQVALRSATHKYIWCDDRVGEFYDLDIDPDETRNLIDSTNESDRAVLAKLQDALVDWQAGLEIFPPAPAERVSDNDDTLTERLRALGYVA